MPDPAAAAPPQSLTWSTQLRLAPTTTTSTALPTGDKLLLPASALEALLSASAASAAATARDHLPAYDPFDSANQSLHRRAEQQYQDLRGQLPAPLTFRVVNPANGRVVYAGIREFSAEEGEVVVSGFLRGALGIASSEGEERRRKKDVEGDEEMSERNDSGQEDAALGTAQREEPVMLTVHARQLSKGTFVKLRPLEAGYDPEDWKALLEQHLRANYTTLTKGEVLVVPTVTAGRKEEFRFLIDSFLPEGAEGICVVDTDLEVDIEALNEEQARETLKRIAEKHARGQGTAQGSSVGGELDLFRAQQGQVVPGEYVDFTLPSWNRALPVEISLDAADGETETLALLVSPVKATLQAKPRIDEFVFGELEARPRKKIRLEPTNVELEGAEGLSVAVYALDAASMGGQSNGKTKEDTAPRAFTLRVQHPDVTTNGHADTNGVQNDDTPPNEDDVRCKNCTHWIPAARMALHEATCYRNNQLCPSGCGQVFQKRSPEFAAHWHCPEHHSEPVWGNTAASQHSHNHLYHPREPFSCPSCPTTQRFPTLPLLAHHRTTTCPGKLILCRFCHLLVPQEGDPDGPPSADVLLSGLTPHELADGARTTECALCGKFVRLRDLATHQNFHELDRLRRPTPVICANALCGRTVRGGVHPVAEGMKNDLGLCAVCFGPLYVSMYDPDGKALRRRIERRYLQQLGTGCGKAWCGNAFCRTGRGNLHPEDEAAGKSVPAKEAVPIVKPVLDALKAKQEGKKDGEGDGEVQVHFCVDEASQGRRMLARVLAEEDGGAQKGGNGGYVEEWWLAALEAEGGNEEKARRWLGSWGVGRAEAK